MVRVQKLARLAQEAVQCAAAGIGKQLGGFFSSEFKNGIKGAENTHSCDNFLLFTLVIVKSLPLV